MDSITTQTVIFTDLDGTLLDLETYSYREAEPGLELIRSTGTPLVFCSAKTRAEQEAYREELGIGDPFIVEDGGALYIPQTYFPFQHPSSKIVDDYQVIRLGLPYDRIRDKLAEAASETLLSVRGYGDMSPDEVAAETELPLDAAERAMAREYGETLVTKLSSSDFGRLSRELAQRGLRLSYGGRFYSVVGPNDKGKAASILIDLFRGLGKPVKTVAIGDSWNDLPLLSSVDQPYLVQKPGGAWDDIDAPNLCRVEAVGPAGWNQVVLDLLSPAE